MTPLRYLTLLAPAVALVCVGTWASSHLTLGQLLSLTPWLLFTVAVGVPVLCIAGVLFTAMIFDGDRGGR